MAQPPCAPSWTNMKHPSPRCHCKTEFVSKGADDNGGEWTQCGVGDNCDDEDKSARDKKCERKFVLPHGRCPLIHFGVLLHLSIYLQSEREIQGERREMEGF